MRTKLRNLWR